MHGGRLVQREAPGSPRLSDGSWLESNPLVAAEAVRRRSLLNRVLPLWRRIPPPVRERFWKTANPALQALTPLRVGRWWRPGAPGGEPVAVAGFHGAVLGLGEGARLFVEALRQGGVDAHAWDLGAHLRLQPELGVEAGGEAAAATVVSHMNAPELLHVLYRTGGRPFHGVRHIGYWGWELPRLPAGWRRAFRYLDEVWCPSAFTADAVREAAGGRLPVRVVPHPMFALPDAQPDRARFGFAPGVCVVLQAFDLRSSAARKNPWGALEAFERAVAPDDPRALLVLKVTQAGHAPEVMQRLEARLSGRANVRLMTEHLSRADTGSLTASLDILLSLHRSEGFGLMPAEAMWAGKAVVATGWSGNMDFMTGETSAIVPYQLVPVDDPQGIYRGSVWAEPDVEWAADALRRLIEDPAARAALGLRAAAHVRQVFDPARWLAEVRPRLAR